MMTSSLLIVSTLVVGTILGAEAADLMEKHHTLPSAISNDSIYSA